MPKLKAQDEVQEKEASHIELEQSKAIPDKISGPQRFARMPLKASSSEEGASGCSGISERAFTMRRIQRTVGNTMAMRFAASPASSSTIQTKHPLQSKLTIGQPGDMYEQEADAAASRIASRKPVDPLSRTSSGGAPKSPNQRLEEKNEESSSERKTDPDTAERALSRSCAGAPLCPMMRERMEESYGADFSDVRVHTGEAAHEAAQALNARAFTHGNHIYLARGESAGDSNLMSHELAHTIQQGSTVSSKLSAQSHRTNRLVQLERGRRRRRSVRQRVYIVRDPGLSLGGGTFVNSLAGFKQHVMRTRNTSDWTLVLAIHGGENRLAAQRPPHWRRNAIFYEASNIDRMFLNDPDWVTWRDTYGPNHLSLVACQVSINFERALIHNLTRHAAGTGNQLPAPTQSAQGLGTGCKPLASIPPMSVGVATRSDYRDLNEADQQRMLRQLRQWNRRFGYYGAPPVPDDQVLDYFFDEVPRGSWVNVEVGVIQADHTLQETGIAFWNRSTGPDAARFRQICNQRVGSLRPRRPSAPPPIRE